jgi:hypothetical protein
MTISVPRVRPRALAAIVAVAAISAAFAVTTSGAHTHPAAAHEHGSRAAALTARQAAFHDAMRKLWEDHVTWTRLAIVSFAAGLPDLEATESRLLRNQTDIGNAMKPYYGQAAGNRLTALLREHILGAVTLLHGRQRRATPPRSRRPVPRGPPTATRSPTSSMTPTRAAGHARRPAR